MEYDDYQRGARLSNEADLELGIPWKEDPGTIQLTHKSGLLLNVPCYHGRQLPEVSAPMKAFWNGKSPALELYQVKNTTEGIKPIVRCRLVLLWRSGTYLLQWFAVRLSRWRSLWHADAVVEAETGRTSICRASMLNCAWIRAGET